MYIQYVPCILMQPAHSPFQDHPSSGVVSVFRRTASQQRVFPPMHRVAPCFRSLQRFLCRDVRLDPYCIHYLVKVRRSRATEIRVAPVGFPTVPQPLDLLEDIRGLHNLHQGVAADVAACKTVCTSARAAVCIGQSTGPHRFRGSWAPQ